MQIAQEEKTETKCQKIYPFFLIFIKHSSLRQKKIKINHIHTYYLDMIFRPLLNERKIK